MQTIKLHKIFLLQPEVLQFVFECDVVKDSGKEEYLRPFIHIGLDWIYASAHHQLLRMGVA